MIISKIKKSKRNLALPKVAIIAALIICGILHMVKNGAVADKPMIYLYPEQEENITVTLGNPEKLTTTYPKYSNGWNVTAEPDGTLTDENGRTYYGLYWEGKDVNNHMFDEGFCVKGEDSAKFLEEKLAILGLNEREANEFIVYWLPILEKNEYNLIRFQTKEEIESYMPLNVSPKPDTEIRIMMEYKPVKKFTKIQEQHLEPVERNGFTVVEWGGVRRK